MGTPACPEGCWQSSLVEWRTSERPTTLLTVAERSMSGLTKVTVTLALDPGTPRTTTLPTSPACRCGFGWQPCGSLLGVEVAADNRHLDLAIERLAARAGS